jgi:hypothetical protein
LPGIVKDLEYKQGRRGNGVYYPVVEIADPQGRTIRFKSEIGSSPPSYRKGDKVRVAYDPLSGDSVIDSVFETYSTVFVVLGVVVLVGAIGLCILFDVQPTKWRTSVRSEK